MSLATDLRARLTVAEETDGWVQLLPVEARDVLAVIEAAQKVETMLSAGYTLPNSGLVHDLAELRAALAVVFADEKETP
jgi:hypothetical protein